MGNPWIQITLQSKAAANSLNYDSRREVQNGGSGGSNSARLALAETWPQSSVAVVQRRSLVLVFVVTKL